MARRDPEARALIDRWAALDPRSGEPEYYRALLDVQSGRPAEALDAMRRAVSLGYPEGPLLAPRAVLLAQAGRTEEAEPVLARAFRESSPPRAEVAESLARIYLATFRLAEAGRVLEGWAGFAPEDPRPYLLRNEIDERTNAEPAVLIRNYREALRRDPGLNDARLSLAEKLREASQVDEAEVEYAELLRRDPKNIPGLVGEGRVAFLKGDIQAAIRDYRAALELDPKEKVALRELGLIDLNSGRIPQALAPAQARDGARPVRARGPLLLFPGPPAAGERPSPMRSSPRPSGSRRTSGGSSTSSRPSSSIPRTPTSAPRSRDG